jgi:hypothetical protein
MSGEQTGVAASDPRHEQRRLYNLPDQVGASRAHCDLRFVEADPASWVSSL